GATPACRNGNCDVDCPGGRKCGDGCVAASEPCVGECPMGQRNCDGRCVTGGAGSCCNDSDCGACKTCQNNRCVNAPDGQPGQNCTGTCKQCQNGTCGDRPNSRVCGSQCVPSSQCCQTCGTCRRCNTGTGACDADNGASCDGGSGTCNGSGTCVPNCVPNTK